MKPYRINPLAGDWETTRSEPFHQSFNFFPIGGTF